MKSLNKELLKSLKVLYVEDEKSIREEVEFILSRIVKELHLASNGLEGLELFNKVNPDIIITDIQMPKMNGLDMIRAIGHTNVPIIITTAYSDIEYFLEAIELKVSKFVIKPMDVEELLLDMQGLIAHSNLKDRLFEKDKLLEIIDENVLISVTDSEGVIIDASHAFCNFVEYSKDELIGQTHRILKHEDTPNSFYEKMWDVIKEGKVFNSEIRNRKKSGEIYWANLTITPVYKDGEIVNFTAIRQDITNKKRFESLTIHDDLTNLYNRRHFNSVLEKEIRRAKREETTLSLVILDVDYFKNYNDVYGHPKGDEVLKKVADTLKNEATRSSDYVFRIGGEEFGILFSGLNTQESFDYVNRIVKDIESLEILNKGSECSQFVTISAGLIVQSSENLDDFENLYKYSDKALYKAKANGRNQLILSDKSH